MNRQSFSFTRLASIKYSPSLPNSKMRSVHNGLIIVTNCKYLIIFKFKGLKWVLDLQFFNGTVFFN